MQPSPNRRVRAWVMLGATLVVGCAELLPGTDRALDAPALLPPAADAGADRSPPDVGPLDTGRVAVRCGGNREVCCEVDPCEGRRTCQDGICR